MSSFVFVVFSERLLAEHHADRLPTSSLYADSSPPEMSLTKVVSSGNLMMGMCTESTGVDSVHIPVLSAMAESLWAVCQEVLNPPADGSGETKVGECVS